MFVIMSHDSTGTHFVHTRACLTNQVLQEEGLTLIIIIIHALTPVLERERLDRKDLSTLCCRLKYCVKSIMITDEKHRDNEVYRIFGELVEKDYL